MRTGILILIIVLACIMVLFGAQNTQPVTVRFLVFESAQISLSLVMIFSALAGAVLAGLFGLWDQVRHGFQRRRMGRQVTTLEKRAADLESQLAAAKQETAGPKETTTGTKTDSSASG